MSKSKTGLIVLAAKLGPKIFPVLSKIGSDVLWPLVKSLFGIKSAGLVASVGLYTYLFTWQMAVALVIFIGIHEYGHIWAMKRCDIKTKGMFFVPGLGAVALATERFKSARNEAYIAIMGPIFGLMFFVLPMGALWWWTRDPMWAAIGAIMAFINLINLFPINPLDGGRILKALAYSERLSLSLAITVAVSLVTAVLGVTAGFTLLTYMAIVGLWEIADEFGIKERIRSFLMTCIRGGVAGTFFFIVPYFLKQPEEAGWVWTTFVGILLLGMTSGVVHDIRSNTVKENRSIASYPLIVLNEVWKGLEQILSLRSAHIRPIDNYDRMSDRGKAWYAFSFLFLCALHATAIYALGQVPGAELASEMLK